MPLPKQKRTNPTEKHLNSHCYILYKKTIENVVRSLQRKKYSLKKIQYDSNLQHINLYAKNNLNPKKDLIQQTRNTIKNQVFQRNTPANQTLKVFKTYQRPKSHSTNNKQKLYFLKQSTYITTKTLKQGNIKLSTKNSSQNQNQTTILKSLKDENHFYKMKCFQSQEKLQKLSKKLHEQKKIHEAQRQIYEQRLNKIKNLIQKNQNEKEMIYQEINQRKTFEGRIPFKVLIEEEQNNSSYLNEQEENWLNLELQSKIANRNSNKVAC